MKNLKTGLLILFAIIIIILIFFLVKSIGNDNNSKYTDKLISEIKYIDDKLTSLLNEMNNISLDNYEVSTTKISTKSSNAGGKQEKSADQSGENQSNSSSQNSNSSEKQSSSTESSNENINQYNLKEERIITNNKDIDWTTIKNEIEALYTIIPTFTLDLYSNNINQEDILNFNKELDELTVFSKDEDKDKILIKLANLYRYLPAYASGFSNNVEYKSLLETKANVFNSYVFANIEDWNQVNSYTRKAIESYTNILNDLNENSNNNNKIYILLNELQTAADIKDKDVFFIKYKNFLKEIEKKKI